MTVTINRNPDNFVNICADSLVYVVADLEPLTLERARNAVEKWLDGYLVGSQVGAVLLNVCYNVSLADSKVWDTAWRKVTGETISYQQLDAIGHWHKHFVRMKELGIDLYQIACSHLRRRGVAPWISVRMNEYHYLAHWETAASFWTEHPEYRLAVDAPFDYSHQEVQDYYLSYIEEQCRLHDVDGVELDMLRGDRFFPQPVSADKVGLLNSFLRQTRRRVDAVAREKGHPIRISARCYPTPESSRQRGWDPVAWMAEGSVDLLTLGNFFIPNCYDIPVERWRELLSKAGVPKERCRLNAGCDYGNFALPFNGEEYRCQRNDTASMKGFAAMAFERGADGIYSYNSFLADSMDWSAFGSYDRAMEGIRRHILTNATDGWEGKDCPPLPAELSPGEERSFTLYTAKRPEKGEYLVRVGLRDPREEVEVLVNGQAARQVRDYTDGRLYSREKPAWGIVEDLTQVAPRIAQYRLEDLSCACDGYNRVTLRSKELGAAVIWLEVAVTCE